VVQEAIESLQVVLLRGNGLREGEYVGQLQSPPVPVWRRHTLHRNT